MVVTRYRHGQGHSHGRSCGHGRSHKHMSVAQEVDQGLKDVPISISKALSGPQSES